jgi:hypothetical protein
MRRFTATLAIFLMFAFFTASPAEAQHQQHHRQQQGQKQQGMMGPGMMQGGMMPMMHRMHQQMMQNPMHRARMMTFMLPALADTLGLSDQQVEQINQLKSTAMAQHKEHQQQMMAQRQELIGLFEGDGQPSTEVVREHVTALAEMRANQQVALYEAAQQMHQELTDEQRQMLDGMTPQQQMHQMMANMPMMDMMQMMRTMHGGQMGGMMQGRMMQNMPMMQRMQNQ